MFFIRSVEVEGCDIPLRWATLQELLINRVSHCASISRGGPIAKVLGERHQTAGGFLLKFAYLCKTEKYIGLASPLVAPGVPYKSATPAAFSIQSNRRQRRGSERSPQLGSSLGDTTYIGVFAVLWVHLVGAQWNLEEKDPVDWG